MARRRTKRTHSSTPTSKQSLTGPLLVGGAVLAGVYFLSRRSSAATPALPATPATPVTPAPPIAATTPSIPMPRLPTPPPSGVGQDPSAALVSLLTRSEAARRIYYVQALGWIKSANQMRPDGIEGPITAALVADINRMSGFPNDATRVTPATIERALLWAAPRTTTRVVPDRLPQATIDAVNRTARAAAPEAPLLQATAA